MVLQVIPTGGGTATANSISIPLTDLSGQGLTAGQMTANKAGIDACLWAVLETVQAFDFSSIVGFSTPANKGFSSAGVGLINQTFSVSSQIVVDKVAGTVSDVPVPASGSNTGIGDFALTDIFPNAAKVAASASVAAEAFLIPTADLSVYDSSIVHASLDLSADSRSLLAVMYQNFAANLLLRSTTDASAIVTTSIGSESVISLPTAYTQATNPTTALVAADFTSGKKFVSQRSYSVTIQSVEQADNSYLVNVVTA